VTSKAVILQSPRGPVAVERRDVREPGPGEVLLRMEACGVCHSDLFVAGLEKLPLAPITLGHEGVARVEAVGPEVARWRAGDRAGMTFLATTCGACELCASGRERFCAKQTNFGYSLDGALSQYAISPAAVLTPLPDDLPAAALAPLCCAGWTAYGALREAGLTSGQSVALFGFGGLGHLALQIARLQNLRVAVADILEAKLQQARVAGADLVIEATTAGRALQKEAGGVDAAIVLTPSTAAIQQAFRSVKRTGTVVLVGIAASPYELPLADTILKGIHIRGSYLGTRNDLQEVIALARCGTLQPQVQSFAIEETPVIFDRLRRGEIPGRAVIMF
jgi:alcohol dehydrogenase, propanol-preferring